MKYCIPFTFFIFLIVFSLSAMPVYAIGISPSRVIVNFEPYYNDSVVFTVINNENHSIYVDLYVQGDLAEYVTLSENFTTITPYNRKNFVYEFHLPGELRPGRHDTRIGAVEAGASGGGEGAVVGGRAGVESQLFVDVPYEGIYIEIGFGATDIPKDGTVNFTIHVTNLGELDVTTRSFIEIFDPAGSSVTEFFAGALTVEPTKREQLSTLWDATGLERGVYSAHVRVEYEGDVVEKNTTFRIGEFIIEIIDAKIPAIPEGTIGRFEVLAESFWIERIDDVYVEIRIIDRGKNHIETVRSETVSILPGRTKNINVFWDTTNHEPAVYNATITLHYGDKVAETSVQVEIISWFVILLFQAFIIIVIILIIVLVYYVKFRKHKKAAKPRAVEEKVVRRVPVKHIEKHKTKPDIKRVDTHSGWVSAAEYESLRGRRPYRKKHKKKKRH